MVRIQTDTLPKKLSKTYTALICDDCETEIFVDINMYMLNDKLWAELISLPPKPLLTQDALCVDCMEKRLNRPITRNDWRIENGEAPPCNYWTEEYRNSTASVS